MGRRSRGVLDNAARVECDAEKRPGDSGRETTLSCLNIETCSDHERRTLWHVATLFQGYLTEDITRPPSLVFNLCRGMQPKVDRP